MPEEKNDPRLNRREVSSRSEEPREPEIVSELFHLHDRCDTLMKMADILQTRLAPVIRLAPEGKDNPPKFERAADTMVGERICSASAKLDTTLGILVEIIDRVEV